MARAKPITPNPVRDARVRAGLRQEDVAKMLGISCAALSRWETGVDAPTAPNLEALVDALPDLTFEAAVRFFARTTRARA